MGNNRFISFEGSEGVGKSTQIALLAQYLNAQGHTVVVTREPGGTPGAEAIRSLLMQGDQDKWNDSTEALLFAAARADHVAKLIKPALAKGKWVLCDRFVDSSRAYQGGAGGLSDAAIMALHEVGSGGFLPELTLLLELPANEGDARVRARGGDADRMGSKPEHYYTQVVQRFRDMASEAPERFVAIDASGSKEEVHTRIVDAVSQRWVQS